MKRFLLVALVLSVASPGLFAQDEGAEPEIADLEKKASYVFGHRFGSQAKEDGLEIDVERFVAGFKDALEGKESQLSAAEARRVITAFQEVVRERQRAAAAEAGERNKEAGEKFLADNAEKEGVQVTESGLQYKVVKEGTGASPAATDTVKVHYHGTLLDGSVFDSSVQREQPATFPLNRVIKGWTEGLQLMKVGGKTTFYIPADLAYGEQGPPGIGPNAVLTFEVELLDIVE